MAGTLGLPAIVKMATLPKTLVNLGMDSADSALITITPGGYSARLPCCEPSLITGKREGADVEFPMKLKPNQNAIIGLPDAQFLPKRYHFLVNINPEIYNYAQVSAPSVVSHLELDSLRALVSTFKTLDLSALSYVFELTAID